MKQRRNEKLISKTWGSEVRRPPVCDHDSVIRTQETDAFIRVRDLNVISYRNEGMKE